MTTDATLYVGHVTHMRLRPRAHRFRYRVFSVLLDIDRLEEATAGLRLMSLNRFGPFSFHERDHGPRDGSPLRPWVEDRLAEAGLPRPARIRLLSMPRMFGCAFNPLSVFYCDDAAGRLESVVHEVKNTFGDQRAYALPATGEGMRRQIQAKEFFVSPFIGMDQTYRFDIAEPGARLAIRIKQGDAEGDVLIAAQNGVAEPLTDRALARLAATHPLMTVKVVAGIRWEALRLFLKGVRFLGHPGDARVHASAAGAAQPGARPGGRPAPRPEAPATARSRPRAERPAADGGAGGR